MNQAEAVRRIAFVLPAFLSVAVVLAPARGYDLPRDIAAASCVALLAASLLTRSDGLYSVSIAGSAALVALEVLQFGLPPSFAVVVLLLVAFDLVGLTKSLFGITYQRAGLQDGGTCRTYLHILRRQVIRSSAIGIATFVISLAIISTPIPLLILTNPVSSSGVLALSTILLILLAAGVGFPAWFSKGNAKPPRR